jgi:hypothetical protein
VLAIVQAGLLWQHVVLAMGASAPRGPQLDWIGADATGGKMILAAGVIVLIVSVAAGWRSRPASGAVLALGVLALFVAIAGYVTVRRNGDNWNAAFDTVRNVPGFAEIRYEIGPGAYLGSPAAGSWSSGASSAS